MRKWILLSLLLAVASLGLHAQTQLKGRVLDGSMNNEPLIGASIQVPGTTSGTISDLDGNFAFQLPAGKFLVQVSMIGYKTEHYRDFGCWAAHIDDIANYLPARLTAILMVVTSGRAGLLQFVWKNGRNHASPNSGYPEAALAGILDCRFGGPHYYFGQLFDKPYIGTNDRLLTTADMRRAVSINRRAETLMMAALLLALYTLQ